jgi:SAM-dependent methyltransferase
LSATIVKRRTQLRFVDLARRWPPLTALVNAGGQHRAASMLAEFSAWLPPRGGRVLDIGTGTGHVAAAVSARGGAVVGCDVVDLRVAVVRFVLGDGGALPFRSGGFDAALLITVLHHVPAVQHDRLLAEALRVLKVGGRLVLFEDTYHNHIERRVTAWQDSAMNLEVAGHPHSNRPLADWRRVLAGLGGVIRHEREFVAWYGLFRVRHGLLIVERPV